MKAVKAPLVDIIGDECTDMRKVEVALKRWGELIFVGSIIMVDCSDRFVDKKGLWWDWNYGKKSKRETGGGYVREGASGCDHRELLLRSGWTWTLS